MAFCGRLWGVDSLKLFNINKLKGQKNVNTRERTPEHAHTHTREKWKQRNPEIVVGCGAFCGRLWGRVSRKLLNNNKLQGQKNRNIFQYISMDIEIGALSLTRPPIFQYPDE